MASRRGFLRLSRVLPTSRVFTSGYVNTETILHFFSRKTFWVQVNRNNRWAILHLFVVTSNKVLYLSESKPPTKQPPLGNQYLNTKWRRIVSRNLEWSVESFESFWCLQAQEKLYQRGSNHLLQSIFHFLCLHWTGHFLLLKINFSWKLGSLLYSVQRIAYLNSSY